MVSLSKWGNQDETHSSGRELLGAKLGAAPPLQTVHINQFERKLDYRTLAPGPGNRPLDLQMGLARRSRAGMHDCIMGAK
jgi:hypothetical protein